MFCVTLNCIASSLGSASSPFPVRLNVTLLMVGLALLVVGVAVLEVSACPEPEAFTSICADFSLFIADELFCNNCRTVMLLPLVPPFDGLHALNSSSMNASAINKITGFLCIIVNAPYITYVMYRKNRVD